MFRTAFGRITILFVVIASFCFGMLLIAAWSVEDALNYEPQLYVSNFDVSVSDAKAYAVFDLQTGTEIASRNAEEVLPIASITKLVTAGVFYENTDLNATTTILWNDLNTEGAAGRLHFAEEYSHHELLFPLLLESSNDAASTMLRVDPDLLMRMGERVASLGLTHTRFADPSGLSSENVSTAYELSVLMRDLYGKQPHIYDITRLSQYIGTHTGWLNNNPFAHEEGYVGGKHGFTFEANKTGVSFFNEVLENGTVRTIGYVVLGSDDLKQDVAVLRQEVLKSVSLQ